MAFLQKMQQPVTILLTDKSDVWIEKKGCGSTCVLPLPASRELFTGRNL